MKRNLIEIKPSDRNKVVKLFHYFKKEYPGIFGDLELRLPESIFSTACVNPIDEYLVFNINGIINTMKEDSSRHMFTNYMKEMQLYNKNISLAEFILLHELGHYLDYIDNLEEYIFNTQDKNKIMDFVYNEYVSNLLTGYIYSRTKAERKATLNAFKMAKVLAEKED